MIDEDLDKILEAWKVEPEIPARFQANVWARIASRETERENSFWRGLTAHFLGLLLRPAYAMALVVTMMGMSLGAARIHSENVNNRRWATLEARYAFSIDPYAQAMERSAR